MTEKGFHLDLTLNRNRQRLSLQVSTQVKSIGLLGPSGVGKSTLLRMIAGLEPKCKGSIVIGGQQLQSNRETLPSWQRQIGWQPQNSALFPHASVLKNMCWGGAQIEDAVVLAERLEIRHLLNRFPRHLSGGEKQRVALGRALLCKPAILLLDEPFSALDVKLRTLVQSIIKSRLKSTNIHLILVSHNPMEMADLCDEVWEMDLGGNLKLHPKLGKS